jgi:hypothetical protein
MLTWITELAAHCHFDSVNIFTVHLFHHTPVATRQVSSRDVTFSHFNAACQYTLLRPPACRPLCSTSRAEAYIHCFKATTLLEKFLSTSFRVWRKCLMTNIVRGVDKTIFFKLNEIWRRWPFELRRCVDLHEGTNVSKEHTVSVCTPEGAILFGYYWVQLASKRTLKLTHPITLFH